jgi:hypothetical protein
MVAWLSLVVPSEFAGLGPAVPVETKSIAVRLAVEVAVVEDNTELLGVSFGIQSRSG